LICIIVYYPSGKGVGAYIVPVFGASAFRMCEIGWSVMLAGAIYAAPAVGDSRG
jgi:hypothetical protein